jgi:enoyl-CoA hydratase/carnithine racemase
MGVLTLNDPFKLNALSVPMGEALLEKVDFLKGVPELRAVILTGKGEFREIRVTSLGDCLLWAVF